jgi:hypothetical protein
MWFLGSAILAFFVCSTAAVFGWWISIRCASWKPFRLSVETVAASLLVGIAAYMLLFGWASQLGAPGKIAGPVILAVSLLLSGPSVVKAFLKTEQPWSRPWRPLVILLGISVTGIVLALTPILLFHAYFSYGDAFTYLSIADYLQDHPFSEPAEPNPFHPVLTQPHLYQLLGLRMGAMYFLSFVQSIIPGAMAWEVYPTVMAIGMVVNAAAIYLACRWTVRLSRYWALGGAFAAIILSNPIHYSTSLGLLPQLYGLAFFAFSLAAWTRFLRKRTWNRKFGAWLAIGTVGLISSYSELFPVLGLVLMFTFIVTIFTKRNQLRSRSMAAGIAAVCVLCLANYELVRMITALKVQLGAVVGGNIPFSLFEFLGVSLGARPGYGLSEKISLGFTLSTALFATLLLIGLVSQVRKSWFRSLTLITSSAIFLLMFFYFRFAVENPWVKGQLGQTWSMFKVSNWVYPVTAVLSIAGLSALRMPRVILAFFTVGAVATSAIIRFMIEDRATHDIRKMTGSERPFEAYAQAAEILNTRFPDGPIELRFSEDELIKHKQMLAYFLHPRSVFSDWRNDEYIGGWMSENSRNIVLNEPHLVVGRPDSGDRTLTELPAQLAILKESFFSVQFDDGWYEKETDNSGNLWRWCNGNAKLIIEAPKDANVVLKGEVMGAEIPTEITVSMSDLPINRIVVRQSGFQQFAPQLLRLHKGKNEIRIRTDKEPTTIGQDNRLLSFALRNLEVKEMHTPRLNFVSGWYGLEGEEQDWWRWSSGSSTLEINADIETHVRIKAKISSAEYPRKIRVIQDDRHIGIIDLQENGSEIALDMEIKLSRGRNSLLFEADGKPVKFGTDTRPLSFLVRNLMIEEGN